MPTRLFAYFVFCMAISVQVYADSSSTNKPDETNAPPVMGQLGYPVGTVLEVEAKVSGCMWNRPPPNLLDIYRVNGQNLKSPLCHVGCRLSKDFPRIHFQIGDICVFKGTESIYTITTNDYKNEAMNTGPGGRQLVPYPPGTYSTFTVTDIISANHPSLEQQPTNAIISGMPVQSSRPIANEPSGVIIVTNKHLTNLDLSAKTALWWLDCSNNDLTNLDISNCGNIFYVNASNNPLAKIIVGWWPPSNIPPTIRLFCDAKPLLISSTEKINCDSQNLMSLDVSGNTKLNNLNCARNRLTCLDVKCCSNLTLLFCAYNRLTNLDVSHNTNLTFLGCGDNQITVLDIDRNTKLKELQCFKNKLTNLDISHNPELSSFRCYDNQLTKLDISSNTNLIYVDATRNPITNIVVWWTPPTISNKPSTLTLHCSGTPTLSYPTDISTPKEGKVTTNQSNTIRGSTQLPESIDTKTAIVYGLEKSSVVISGIIQGNATGGDGLTSWIKVDDIFIGNDALKGKIIAVYWLHHAKPYPLGKNNIWFLKLHGQGYEEAVGPEYPFVEANVENVKILQSCIQDRQKLSQPSEATR